MYASVHDAALVVGTAVQNLMNSNDGMETIDSHFTNSHCPLRSTSTLSGELGWKLLQQMKKVNTTLFNIMFARKIKCLKNSEAIYTKLKDQLKLNVFD